MALEDDGQSKAIAAEWEIDPGLLDEADWDLESIDSNDGFTVGYFIRFSEDTDRGLLDQLGVSPGEFYRALSLNAFDQPDDEEEYERYRAQYGGDRRRIADRYPDEWGKIMNDYAPGDSDNAAIARNGAAFVGSSFAGHSFAIADDGISSIDEPLPDIGDGDDNEYELTKLSEQPSVRQRRYKLEDQQITAADFRELNPARRIEVMLQWFHDKYEDPAVRTPYESAEGGYQWIWGGPYDAHEQIGDEFSDIADEDEIEAAVDEVEKDGLVDWAPKPNSDDYDAPEDNEFALPDGPVRKAATTNFADAHFGNFAFSSRGQVQSSTGPVTDEDFRREVLSRIEVLEASLETYRENLPPRNHNHPPELVEPDPISPREMTAIVKAIAEAKVEAAQLRPDPLKLEQKASIFRKVAGSILKWIGRKADKAVDSMIGKTASAVGTASLIAGPDKVYAHLMEAANALSAWVHYLVPF